MKTTFKKLANKSFLAAALTLVFTFGLNAATRYTSVQSGNWSAGATWSSSGSGTPITYTINSGHTVTLDANTSGIDTLYINGTLSFGNNRRLTMTQTGIITVSSTGSIIGGSNNSYITFASASINIYGPFTAGNNAIINNGPRSATLATMNAANGDPQGSFPLALPVDLKSLSVEKAGNDFVLSWVALGESNHSDFIIEISANGSVFTTAGTVNGNNEISEGAYEFNLGAQKGSFYVRLTEITANSSDKLAVKFVKNTVNTDASFSFFPTVINASTATANIVLPAAGDYKVSFFSTTLQNVANTDISTSSDNELKTIALDNISLNPGTYFTVVTGNNGQVYKTKILVQ